MSNYYVSSFIWGVLAKVLNAVFGVLSVPLLLSYFKVENYGILTLATSVNAYMHLLDLGMHVGAVKFFSQWIYEKKHLLLDKVVRTSISFYGVIGIINTSVLIVLAIFGRNFFNVTDNQFLLLQKLLLISASFSIVNWLGAVFSQLLTAAQKIAFVHKIMSVSVVCKIALIYVTIYFHLSIELYFVLFSFFLAVLLIPYAILSRRLNLISSLKPCFEWNEFKIVLIYSLSIFALSFFQMCAASSRPIILGMFASTAAVAVAHYNVVQLMPSFILSVNGVLASLLLPKASVIVSQKDDIDKFEKFILNGTKISTILCMSLCLPIILCSKGLLAFVVGSEYIHLSFWLSLAVIAFCFNLPTSVCNSLVLAIGKTKPLICATAILCVLSISLNIILAPQIGMGSAIIAYFVYVITIALYNYFFYYPKLFNIKTSTLIFPMIKPIIFGVIPTILLYMLFHFVDYSALNRLQCFGWFLLIGGLWYILYGVLLLIFKEISIKNKRIIL